MESDRDRLSGIKALVLVLVLLVVAFHLGSALTGRPLLRAMHLGTALEFADHRIDLLHPTIVGFSANDSPAAEELPLWQAAVAALFKLTGSRWYGWANLVSLLVFIASLWPFFRLARAHLGAEPAWWATAFFVAEPLIAIMGGFGATDGFSIAVTLWFVYFADQLLRAPKLCWWIGAAASAALAAVTKLPFFMAAGLGLAFWLAAQREKRPLIWIRLGSLGVAALIAFVAWTRHTDHLAAQAQFPYYELRMSHSHDLRYWYFGNLHTRLSPGMWLKGAWRFLHGTLGSPVFLVPLIAALLIRGNVLAKCWLAAGAVTTVVFTHAVLVHWHYYLMFCPAVALLCGATIAGWQAAWQQQLPQTCLRVSLIGAALVASSVDGIVATKISIFYDPYPRHMAELIRQHTNPDDRLIVYGGFWGGEELFRASRRGFYVYSFRSPPGAPTMTGLYELLDSPADLQKLKEKGYNKLVMMSESPVRYAVEAANPGSQRKRLFYPDNLPAKTEAWPVVYKSDDLLIKEIP